MKRSLSFDLLRLLACLMVILMHSPISGDAAVEHGAFLTAVSYLTSPCVPLFFMVSGALLLNGNGERVVTTDWLKHRLGKVVWPTVVFSLFYIFLYVPSSNWGVAVLSIPFSPQGHGVLWFMYALIGLYLITPIIKPWLNSASEKEVWLYLVIWGVSLLFPYLGLLVDVNSSITGTFYYLAGYAGYFLLGYYLTRWTLNSKVTPVVYLLALLVLPLPLLNKMLGWNLDFYSAFWYLSAPVCIMTVAWFSAICRVFGNDGKSYPLLATLSNLSFGVYLVHIFIMRDILWNLNLIKGIDNYYIQTGVVFLLTAILSFGVCWLISLLPFGQYIIGYKNTKK